MNQRQAFDDTIALAVERGMLELPGTAYGLAHLKDMQVRLEDGFSDSKVGRWLGWAQCAVVMQGIATLDEMKGINLKNA